VRAEIDAWLAPGVLAGAPCFETNATRRDAGVAQLDAFLRERATAWRRAATTAVPARRRSRVHARGAGHGGDRHGVRGTRADRRRHAARARRRGARAQHPRAEPAADTGRAGERCALNLAGIDKAQIARGDWIVDAACANGDASRRRTAPARRCGHHAHALVAAARPSRHAHRVASVALLDGDALGAGETARVQLVFDAPLHALPGDRFIVRNAQASARSAAGACSIRSVRRAQTHAGARAWLDALRVWLDEGRIDALIAEAPRGLAFATLTQLTGQAADTLALPADA
jgi:selenocysteine-specific elongation factor